MRSARCRRRVQGGEQHSGDFDLADGYDGQISKEITAGTDAASASVELVGGLMDYFSNINDATDEASQIVDEEYKIIEHVKEHFGNIQQEIETLVATSEENSATIQNITDTITSQNDSIRSISAEIDEISSLSAIWNSILGKITKKRSRETCRGAVSLFYITENKDENEISRRRYF